MNSTRSKRLADVLRSIALALVAASLPISSAATLTGQGVTTPSDVQRLDEEVQRLHTQFEKLSGRVDTELAASKQAFETTKDFTGRAFTVLGVLGGIGGFLAGMVVVAGWLRENKQREDYKHEREFYESSVKHLEVRQDGVAERDKKLSEQQLELGKQFLTKSDGMLSGQIDSIAKLGAVIGLIQQTFDMQFKRAAEEEQERKRTRDQGEVISAIMLHHEHQYQYVTDLMLPFRFVNRMQWTRLSPQEQNTTARARGMFEGIYDFVRNRKADSMPYEYAQLCQLLGVSAFYANDVGGSLDLLHTASKVYDTHPQRDQDKKSRMSCAYYLGLIAKTWRETAVSVIDSLREAKRYIETANDMVSSDELEALTPITLAEVQSYIPGDSAAAREILTKNINMLNGVAGSARAHANHAPLLTRAYLIMGNIALGEKDITGAGDWYERALMHDPLSAYALLSLAYVTPRGDPKRKERFARALELLQSSRALEKRELTTRGMVLAWAAIAARESGADDKLNKYFQELDALAEDVRSVRGREPMFFSPIAKRPVPFDQLRDEMSREYELPSPLHEPQATV